LREKKSSGSFKNISSLHIYLVHQKPIYIYKGLNVLGPYQTVYMPPIV